MAATVIPFDLVEAKLAEPMIRPGTLSKADAIARLCSASMPFAIVVAPAGYGKTTLLARWAEADPRPFAWVALDGRDDDDVVFLRYIAVALHRVEPLATDVFDALSGPGGVESWSNRVPRLGRALASLERPLVLVLDDLHAVANPSCLDVLAELVQHVPTGSQIVVATREEPNLPLARWRVQGWVGEIGVTDLRLDEREAELLLGAAGVELEADELYRADRAHRGLARRPVPRGAVDADRGRRARPGSEGFNGDDQFVSEYFHSELLSRLPAAEAAFLMYTSVLERMCGGLCDAVLETTGRRVRSTRSSARTASSCASTGGASGTATTTCSVSCCGASSSEASPTWWPCLNGRAMVWCIANDLPEEAIVYGQAAGDADTVAGLVDVLALQVYFDGRQETVEEWLGWFDEEELAQYPALAVYGAWIRVLTGRPAEAEQWLALADGKSSEMPLSDGSATIEPWVATLRAYMMPNGVEQALADADLALEQLSSTSGWFPVALLGRGVAHDLLGATESASNDLAAAVERGLVAGSVQTVYVAQAQLSLLAAKQGNWGEAAERARAALALVEETGLDDYAGSALALVAAARVALHQGRDEEARAVLTRAHRLRPLLDHGLPWLTVEVGLELTRAHLALTEAAAARTILAETERVLELRPGLGALVADARELHERVAATSGSAGAWAMSLTGAELRLLPYLSTHLSFPEIAPRLFISRNTVKTEAVSIYRKLGASSRSQAIERAVEVGLLESNLPPPANLTQQV